jgi:hypothetical protein
VKKDPPGHERGFLASAKRWENKDDPQGNLTLSINKSYFIIVNMLRESWEHFKLQTIPTPTLKESLSAAFEPLSLCSFTL